MDSIEAEERHEYELMMEMQNVMEMEKQCSNDRAESTGFLIKPSAF
jgi:hypothetical protein